MAVRVRRLLARPRSRQTLVIIVALATGLSVVSLVRSAEQARDRWGTTRAVVVARRDLVSGDIVDDAAVELREVPEATVAEAALTEIPTGAVIRQPMAAGEPLVEARIAPDGLTGVAALVPAGHRAISIPVGPAGAPPVAVGDQVDVLAVLPPASDIHGHGPDDGGGEGDEDEDDGDGAAGVRASGGGYGIGEAVAPIVERSTVVHVRDEAISIAVPTDDAPSVAAVLTQGVVLLALAGA